MATNPDHKDVSAVTNTFPAFLEAFKKRHAAWFGMPEVKKGEEGPEIGLFVPKRPIVEPRKNDFWDGEDDRND